MSPDVSMVEFPATEFSSGMSETACQNRQRTGTGFSSRLVVVRHVFPVVFVDQALPNDLIKRGMAVPDFKAPYGTKLVIEDYPYAKDGLDLWAAIRTWVGEHIDIFYADDKAVQADAELQNWWTEVRTRGHADVTDGWIMADSKENLVQIVTTIAWVASCHHAAVNFGQYLYAGFVPNHPSMTRKLIPDEGTPAWEAMQRELEAFLLSMLANTVQSKINMTTIEVLSSHAANEEYLGECAPNWTDNPKVLAAFEKFGKNVDQMDALIKSRNADPSLKHWNGVTKVAYELLRPKSDKGLTNKGIPNSVSIQVAPCSWYHVPSKGSELYSIS